MSGGDGIGFSLKAFWHTMTSYDRHAGHNSPYRTTGSGQGVGRNPSLNGVRTSVYHDDLSTPGARSTTALAGGASAGIYSPPPFTTGSLTSSPTQAYSPGARSMSIAAAASVTVDGSVPLQDFSADGLPPPPPIKHSWTRIERWTESNYPELTDQLCEGATANDINELEFDLDCSLPIDFRESIMCHDGQERGGTPTGIIFGAMLLDCEEILDEWKNWKVVNQEYLSSSARGTDGEAGPSKSKTSILGRQDSSPEGAVEKVYAHPGWIPVARDWGGNNLAIDLAPGPTGKWGQVILCGRDYDCKYVVARSWASFLAMVADDMESPYWYVDEETQELKLKDPRAPRREPSYFDILRVRNMQKYKRVPVKTASGGSTSQPNSAPGSPSSSNTSQDRGRKPSSGSRHSSPGTSLQPPKSRLSRVTEEAPAVPLPAHTKFDGIKGKENGSSQPLYTILDEPVALDKASLALKALEEVSLDNKPEILVTPSTTSSASKIPTIIESSELPRTSLTGSRKSVEA
ncbi:hypothetical protein DFH27DRAFT_390804 [Peziza echinospora]|nr:hypothetical protein DFH27DRAFT_390804 [Peziza echinospora]